MTAAEQREPQLDVTALRRDFPGLAQQVHGKPLVYLDNAATAHKPRVVLDAMQAALTTYCANVHRGVHWLSARATEAFEGVRPKVRRFLHAVDDRECIFTRGTTEAINLLAQSYGRVHVHPGDNVVITAMEHHSNIVPWQMLCQERGAELRVITMDRAGVLDMTAAQRCIDARTRIVAASHVSNALGTINPIADLTAIAHAHSAVMVVDGAQAAPHLPIDVQALGCDFYAFSAHKIFGPTGVGVLWGRAELLEAMPPWQGGGDMIASVTFAKTTYNVIPHRFEAGTPDIAGVIAFGAALDYLDRLDPIAVMAYERHVLTYCEKALRQVPGLTLIGTSPHKVGVASFVLDAAHPHDVGTVLDQDGIAIRTGHHCAQPVMEFFDVPATCRASIAFYNTEAEIDTLVAGLHKVHRMFAS